MTPNLPQTLEPISAAFGTPDFLDQVPGTWTPCGRAVIRHTENSVIIRDGFLANSTSWRDAEIRLQCRAPSSASEVQIWAGFRMRNRHDRYMVALRGGNNNHVYLMRHGGGGLSRFLGVSPLETSPGKDAWHTLRIVLCGSRIQVYVNDAVQPDLDVEDDANGWTEGGVLIGGGYLDAEYGDITVRELPAHDQAGGRSSKSAIAHTPDNTIHPALSLPAAYRPVSIQNLEAGRTEVSLDGQWLFLPLSESVEHGSAPSEPAHDDREWLTIDVPNLWTPSLAWLHGETTFHEFEGVSRCKGVNDKVWIEEIARLESHGFDWEQTQLAWYRHHILLPDDLAGRRFELRFDAIAKACEVWFNGILVGTHVGMFGEIRCDVTAQARPGDNILAVKVLRNPRDLTVRDNKIVGLAESVEVTTGMLSSMPRDMICHDPAGIWQPVKLVVTDTVFVRDVFVQPTLGGAGVDIEIDSAPSAGDAPVEIGYVVRKAGTDDTLVAVKTAASGIARELGRVHVDLPEVTPDLWTPETPHLYELEIRLHRAGRLVDTHCTTFGFRTFSTEGNRFLLNGKPYWLRGANHFPHGVKPNDRELARRFIALAREGNVRATRSHVAPFTKAWVEETDRQGMLVSFEGIWPWLMLKGEIPDRRLLDIWRDDFTALIRKYRNHPSIVLWTVNNEMKFYVFDADNHDLLRAKWAVASDMVRSMRKLDPTRPIVVDSGYVRGAHRANYEAIVRANRFDDGDVDDVHQYYGWYHPSFTTAHAGEFAKGIASPDRPFISQELSSGYPRNDDGLPVRFYLFKHGTPQALVGDYAFEHNDPRHFLERLAFILKHTGEAIRRSNRGEVAGFMHFAYLTWFKDVHDARTLQPWQAPYQAVRSTLQPVLISADFFGLHFFGGETLATDLHLINDGDNASDLPAGTLEWIVRDDRGTLLKQGRAPSPPAPYYDNRVVALELQFPDVSASAGRIDATLEFRLLVGDAIVSQNTRAIVLADRSWSTGADFNRIAAKSLLCDPRGTVREPLASSSVVLPGDIAHVSFHKTPLLIIAGEIVDADSLLPALRRHLESGGRVLCLNTGSLPCALLPDVFRSWRAVDGQIVNLKLPESPVFAGVEPLDIAWLNCGPDLPPTACDGVYDVDIRHPAATVLAEFCDFHNYLNKLTDIAEYTGTPLVECRVGDGRLVAWNVPAQALSHDPVARRLLSNLLGHLQA